MANDIEAAELIGRPGPGYVSWITQPQKYQRRQTDVDPWENYKLPNPPRGVPPFGGSDSIPKEIVPTFEGGDHVHTQAAAHSELPSCPKQFHRRKYRTASGGKLTIGADCAGIGAGIMALKRVSPHSEVIFMSEQDDDTREQLRKLNPHAKSMRSNVLARPAAEDQHVDVYICGFPCQKNSYLNPKARRPGVDDDAKTGVLRRVIDYIKRARPKLFILENVRGLLSAQDLEGKYSTECSMT